MDPAKAGISFRDVDGVRVWDADNVNAALAKKGVFFGPMTLQHCIDACSQAREVLNLSERVNKVIHTHHVKCRGESFVKIHDGVWD